MVRQILDYQRAREDDPFKSSPITDPTGLVLNELKEWLVELSGYNEADIDVCYTDVKKRKAYLKELHDAQIFPPGRGLNRLELLTNLESILESQVQPYLKFLPDFLSARE